MAWEGRVPRSGGWRGCFLAYRLGVGTADDDWGLGEMGRWWGH